MAIKNTVLDSTVTTIYTSSVAAESSAVTVVYLCNRGAGSVTVNIYAVSEGSTATEDNIIYYALQITPKDTFVLDTERLILKAGDFIAASASTANSIVATVSYMDI